MAPSSNSWQQYYVSNHKNERGKLNMGAFGTALSVGKSLIKKLMTLTEKDTGLTTTTSTPALLTMKVRGKPASLALKH